MLCTTDAKITVINQHPAKMDYSSIANSGQRMFRGDGIYGISAVEGPDGNLRGKIRYQNNKRCILLKPCTLKQLI